MRALLALAVALLLCRCATVPAPVLDKSTSLPGPPPVTSAAESGRAGRVAAAPPPARTAQDYASRPAAPEAASHVVGAGETLYFIAWLHRLDYRELARWNRIAADYRIYPGQRLRLRPPPTAEPVTTPTAQPAPASGAKPDGGARAGTTLDSPGLESKKRGNGKSVGNDRAGGNGGIIGDARAATTPSPPPPPRVVSRPDLRPPLRWRWPAGRALLDPDAAAPARAAKGVVFNGRLGQDVAAAAAGEVVYSGSGLLGYGKLVIIKHDDAFLSAYAYNKKILVREGERVRAGQRIATMGAGIKGQPALRFEIRKDGKPVNPLHYLPRKS